MKERDRKEPVYESPYATANSREKKPVVGSPGNDHLTREGHALAAADHLSHDFLQPFNATLTTSVVHFKVNFISYSTETYFFPDRYSPLW